VDARGVVLVGYWEVRGNGGGVARSTDGGNTFTILKGIEGESVRALAIAPASPQILAVGNPDGVFRSIDGGQTWARITPPDHADLGTSSPSPSIPVDPNTMYVGTWHLGWKTVDGGQNWLPMHTGMIDDSDVMTLTVDRWKPQVVYATACTGIYRSEDAAGRWTKIKGIPSSSRRTRSFAQSPDDQNRLFAGTTEGPLVERGQLGHLASHHAEEPDHQRRAHPARRPRPAGDGRARRRAQRGWRTHLVRVERRLLRAVRVEGRLRPARPPRAGRHLGRPQPRRCLLRRRDRAGRGAAWARGSKGREVLSLTLLGRQALAGTDDGVFVADPETGPGRACPTSSMASTCIRA
jgi:hypothetical protein